MTRPRPRRPKRKSPTRRHLHFERLNDTQFEEFTVDLLHAMEFVNIDWRKGTGKGTSPADSGRDIACQLVRRDVDGSVGLEKWFVDCKHFTRGVPPTELHNLMAWAQAERPDTALFVVSNFLSNAAKDHLNNYNLNQKPPFKIKVRSSRKSSHTCFQAAADSSFMGRTVYFRSSQRPRFTTSRANFRSWFSRLVILRRKESKSRHIVSTSR